MLFIVVVVVVVVVVVIRKGSTLLACPVSLLLLCPDACTELALVLLGPVRPCLGLTHPHSSEFRDFLHRSSALDGDSDPWRMYHACQGPVASAAREAMSCWERELSVKMNGPSLPDSTPAERDQGPAEGSKGQCVLNGHWAQ